MTIADIWANPDEGWTDDRTHIRKKIRADIDAFIEAGGQVERIAVDEKYIAERKRREQMHSWSSEREKRKAYNQRIAKENRVRSYDA